MSFYNDLTAIKQVLFQHKNLIKAEKQLAALAKHCQSDSDMHAVQELLALVYRQQKNFSRASTVYQKLDNPLLAGYCQLLNGKLSAAANFWRPPCEIYPKHWVVTLYAMITRQLNQYPTLLQIRNNLEVDVCNLVEAKRFEYLENIYYYLPTLSYLNLEAYKMCGRALLNTNQLDRVESFLMLGQKALPSDPETYYHLGQYYYRLENYKESLLMLKQCLLIMPNYYPAAVLTNKVKEIA
ncbi:MAG: tetratricopeptide repeat protein [Cyanobacteria bacterium P01_H01_bin.74]